MKSFFLDSNFKWLKHILIFSIVLNGVFLSIFFYFFVRENPLPLFFAYQPITSSTSRNFTNYDIYHSLEKLKSEQLFQLLSCQKHIEDGVKVRDLALGILVLRDSFDIERAFGKKCLPYSHLKVEGGKACPLFTQLSGDEHAQLVEFAKFEKCPFAFSHILQKIKELGEEVDPCYLQMFFQSDEVILVERLFKNTSFPIQKKVIFSLLKEGSYKLISDFTAEQKIAFDLSSNKQKAFLLSYVKENSKTAALLLINIDMPFAIKYLDEEMVIKLLQLLPENNERGAFFAAKLLQTYNSDRVKEMAKKYLSQDKEIAAKFYNRPGEGILQPAFRAAHPKALSPTTHNVQMGESLWSISRKYNISVEDLVRINHLPSTTIQPGKLLTIP